VRFLLAAMWLPLAAAAGDMIELRFQDRDADGTAYPTRMLVTPDHLRIDRGRETDDFTLLDRRAKVVFSVEPSAQRILRIEPLPVPDVKPDPWKVEERAEGDRQGPHRVFISVNGRSCGEIRAVPGLYPDAAAALREYRLALAGMQWRTHERTPPELRDDCDLARHVLEIGRETGHGFPVEEFRHDGSFRRLLAQREIPEQRALFLLPALPVVAIGR
jgi:hypothetical protein